MKQEDARSLAWHRVHEHKVYGQQERTYGLCQRKPGEEPHGEFPGSVLPYCANNQGRQAEPRTLKRYVFRWQLGYDFLDYWRVRIGVD